MYERVLPPIEIHRQLIEVHDGGLLRECSMSENGAERSDMVEGTPMIIVPGQSSTSGTDVNVGAVNEQIWGPLKQRFGCRRFHGNEEKGISVHEYLCRQN